MNFKEPIYDCTLEQTLGCTLHPSHKEDDNAAENGPDAKSNLQLLDQAMQEVSNAIVEIGSYDDESETLIYHTEKLAEAEPASTQVRKTCTPTPEPPNAQTYGAWTDPLRTNRTTKRARNQVRPTRR